MDRKTIWIDITNVPHVNFLYPIIMMLRDRYDIIYTIRDFAETKNLFEKRIGSPYLLIGTHKGGNKVKKLIGKISRDVELYKKIPHFDYSISIGGANIIAWLRNKPSITFDDNEKSPNWLYAPFADLAFWPKVISKETLLKQHFKKSAIYQYNGYKEDFYLAEYEPDVKFLDSLPFKDYVVVRAENTMASYVKGKETIVPTLLKRLNEENYNVLFLPRYASDRELAAKYQNVFIPDGAVNGLDACYFSKAVLTGAGTMAREAACLGVPAVSFYAGDELLTVDRTLVEAGKMFFSRDVDSIMDYLHSAKRSVQNLDRCKAVQSEILSKIEEFLKLYK